MTGLKALPITCIGIGDCNRYSEMSEVPPTVSYADADGYHCYSLNTTCTLLFNAHPIRNYITSYIITILRHSSVTIVTVLDILRGTQMVWIHSVILHLALCAALR